MYASHVLEHASYQQPRPGRGGGGGAGGGISGAEAEAARAERRGRLGLFAEGEVAGALAEWARVLRPGGALFVAVPDLGALAGLYANASLSAADKFFVMRMIYGGQVDGHDFHKTGFDEALLAQLLSASGFCEVRSPLQGRPFQAPSLLCMLVSQSYKPVIDGVRVF